MVDGNGFARGTDEEEENDDVEKGVVVDDGGEEGEGEEGEMVSVGWGRGDVWVTLTKN